jgi:Na+/melibiose symporter-like transporter
MGTLLKFIFWLFLIFWIINQVAKAILKFYFKKIFDHQSSLNKTSFATKSKRKNSDDEGEYIDYEIVQ